MLHILVLNVNIYYSIFSIHEFNKAKVEPIC